MANLCGRQVAQLGLGTLGWPHICPGGSSTTYRGDLGFLTWRVFCCVTAVLLSLAKPVTRQAQNQQWRGYSWAQMQAGVNTRGLLLQRSAIEGQEDGNYFGCSLRTIILTVHHLHKKKKSHLTPTFKPRVCIWEMTFRWDSPPSSSVGLQHGKDLLYSKLQLWAFPPPVLFPRLPPLTPGLDAG